jgi:uroporphyrinogen-III synthase
MDVIVTRPQPEADRWAGLLRARGLAVRVLPLIVIEPPPRLEPLRGAWPRLGDWRAVMFVSGSAVHGFFGQRSGPFAHAWPANTRAWATGPGTRDALRLAGVPDEQIDAPADDAGQFDSEALWERVRGGVGPNDAVLIVRGGDAHGQAGGREWLAGQLASAGARVDTLVAYARHCPAWGDAERAAAVSAADGRSTWLFSSSEAIANLCQLLPAQDWSGGRAVATHPRIAQAARDAGFGVVQVSRPTLDALVATLESAR